MSFLSKPVVSEVVGTAVDAGGAGGGLVDPTLEITQPGGPFPFGHGILADGAGSYTLAATLRPYFISFTLPAQVGIGATVDCEHQGVVTSTSGFIVPFAANLIAITISVDTAAQAAHTYDIEIVRDPTGTPVVVGTLTLDPGERTDFRRDLSVAIAAGVELGARVIQTAGTLASVFSTGIIVAELEL